MKRHFSLRQREWLLMITLFVALMSTYNVFAQDEHAEAHADHDAHGASAPEVFTKKKKQAVLSYGDYMNNLRRLCEKIDKDGRKVAFFTMVNAQANVTNPDCKACRPWFRSLAQACKPDPVAKVKKKKEPEHSEGEGETEAPPTPTPLPHTIKQREPHIQVLDLTSRIFEALAEDEDMSEPTVPALQALLVILRDEQNKTPGEIDYFSILAEFMEAPFLAIFHRIAYEQQKQAEAEQEGGVEVTNPKSGLDDLF